ncbi:MAG: DM13 domain-containing protein [Pseudomonadota bacterium]
MKFAHTLFAALAIGLTGMAACAPATAQTQIEASLTQTVDHATSGDFVRKSKRLKGSWSVVERDGKTFIAFDEDFRAANGPDLKVFLSPSSVANATGKNAVNGSVNIGVLKKTRGVQEYEVPAGINLSDYGSVLIHCEAYSVLWGGSDL